MKLNLVISCASLALLIGGLAPFASSENPAPTRDLMRRKLDHAQSVLEGICISDFEMIAANAGRLGALSNEAAWRAVDTPEYLELSALFQRNVGKLKKAAMDRNLDATTLAYAKITFSCVDCHKYLRDRKLSLGPDSREALPRQLSSASARSGPIRSGSASLSGPSAPTN